MSDQLDRRIRDLYAELTDAAPALPPLPEQAPAGGWLRRLPVIALAAAAAVAVVVATAGVLSLTVGSDDAGDVEASSETTTTASPATFPTTTSAADNGDAADTTGAPATTPAPVDALSLQCASFARAMEPALATATSSAEAFEAALDDLEGELFGLRTIVPELSPEDRVAAEEAISAVDAAISEARGGFPTVTDELADIDAALTGLGETLADLGARECDSLAELLP
jgi:hypothetical protein